LPHFRPAAFPSNETQAFEFRNGLCVRWVEDVRQMQREFVPLALDAEAAFRGVIGSMEEQLEKVTLAATGEEESRYAQHTLADMRANVEGGEGIYRAFQSWLRASGGDAEDQGVMAGFARLTHAYSHQEGDALPSVPSTWSSAQPSEADLQTPFGQLFVVVRDEANPDRAGSTVEQMRKAAERMRIPQLPEL
jgi:iron uptake system component EfeO